MKKPRKKWRALLRKLPAARRKRIAAKTAELSEAVRRRILRGAVEAAPFAKAVIAKNLKQARLEAGLSQAELARRLRVSHAAVGRRENGVTNAPTKYAERAFAICGRETKKLAQDLARADRG